MQTARHPLTLDCLSPMPAENGREVSSRLTGPGRQWAVTLGVIYFLTNIKFLEDEILQRLMWREYELHSVISYQ